MKKIVAALCLAGLTATFGTACSQSTDAKEEVADTSQELTTGQTRIAGSLDYGQTSPTTQYRRSPRRYVAYKFSGNAGDVVNIRVTSNNGDPVTWLLDNDWHILAKNDDTSSADTNSTIKATLPANASNTHYIVVRDYWLDPMSFRVKLDGTTADLSAGCNVDADCEKIAPDCCELARPMIAVKKGNAAAYRDSLNCPEPLMCLAVMPKPDHGMAQCNFATHKCENVQPKDIQCGGFTMNPHSCPDNYSCRGPEMIADAPGKCVQHCGGFAGFTCHDENDECVDDPTDSCDPKAGGADCGGICVPKSADCRSTGCGEGSWCSMCWGGWACIPHGAMC